MQVKFTKKGTTLVISIVGELDHHSAEYIKEKIDGELMRADTKNVVFDFSKVSFMDSSGIGVILGRYKSIQQINGKASIASASSQIKRIFEMAGLSKIIPLYDNIEKAVNEM